MCRAITVVLAILIVSGIAFSQNNGKPLAFDATDVHASKPHSIVQNIQLDSVVPVTGGTLRNGRYTLHDATMLELIRTAYEMDGDRIVGGPTWLESDRFDVNAKVPPGTPRDKLTLMLRTLLADRFQLKLHTGTKPMQAYVLTIGKNGPKMKKASGPDRGGCAGQSQAPAQPGGLAYLAISCHGVNAEDIAQKLHQMAGGYLGDHPLVDSTKLDGLWDFDLKWSARNQVASSGAGAITIFDAVDKQLGLKLELKKADVAVLIVDAVNEKPTDNLPGVSEMFPAAPTEFEVAVVKPSAPEVKRQTGGFQPGGRIDLRGFTLKMLITMAWQIPPNIAGDLIAGGPNWIDSACFDIIARPPNADPSKANELPDQGTVSTMLQNLLIDQFKLKMQTENRDTTVYVLSLKGEPKLKQADPNDRSGCKRGPGPPNPNGTSTVMETCVNRTMAELAKDLSLWAPVYFDHPVFDATGLTGGWNFTLTWTGRDQLLGPQTPKDAAGASLSAADPGGQSAFEALEKLGFKLQTQKRAIPVNVIDHAEQPSS